jgi:hypothetical protein
MLEIKGPKGKQPAYYKPRDRSKDFWKSLVKITIWVLVITILLIGAAFVYAWYSSQHAGGNPSTASTVKPTPKLTAPHKPAPDAQIGVATQFVTSPVAPGDNASISIHTNAAARCTITVLYDKTNAVDSGLMPKIADDYGLAQWSWTIPVSAPLGKKSSVDVWCANTKKNAHVVETLDIETAKAQ